MGQEKSVPSKNVYSNQQSQRYSAAGNKNHHQNTYSTPYETSPHGNPSKRSSTTSIQTVTTDRSTQTTSTTKTSKHQKKYLNEHLYIKSYLDIEEDKRKNTKVLSEQSRSGLRNYTPKILTKSSKSNDKDIWI